MHIGRVGMLLEEDEQKQAAVTKKQQQKWNDVPVCDMWGKLKLLL